MSTGSVLINKYCSIRIANRIPKAASKTVWLECSKSYWLERKKGSKLKSAWKLADISSKPNSEQIKAEWHKVFIETKAFPVLLEQEPAQMLCNIHPGKDLSLKKLSSKVKFK